MSRLSTQESHRYREPDPVPKESADIFIEYRVVADSYKVWKAGILRFEGHGSQCMRCDCQLTWPGLMVSQIHTVIVSIFTDVG